MRIHFSLMFSALQRRRCRFSPLCVNIGWALLISLLKSYSTAFYNLDDLKRQYLFSLHGMQANKHEGKSTRLLLLHTMATTETVQQSQAHSMIPSHFLRTPSLFRLHTTVASVFKHLSMIYTLIYTVSAYTDQNARSTRPSPTIFDLDEETCEL